MTSIVTAVPPSAHPHPSPPKQGVKRAALVLLALAGVTISGLLAAMSGSADGSLASSLCTPSARVNCEHVLASDAARIGPISSALLGFVYFAALLVWFIFVGTPNRPGRKWHLVPIGLALIGNTASLYFVYLMAVELPVWCIWCVAAHVANALILLLALIAWPRAEINDVAIRTSAYPSNIRAGITLGAVLSLSLIMLLAGIAIHHQINSVRLHTENHKLVSDVDYIAYKHQIAPKHEFVIDSMDAIIGKGDAKHTLVVFSDFECAACATLHSNANGLVKSFPEVRVVFRQFPMCADCNPNVKQSFHRHACDAAMAAVAFAELVPDQTLRAKYMGQLFDSRSRFAGRPYAALAQGMGKIGVEDFEKAVRSPSVESSLADDIKLGIQLGLEGTPSMFLDGRRLSTWRIVTIDGKPDKSATKKLWNALLK